MPLSRLAALSAFFLLSLPAAPAADPTSSAPLRARLQQFVDDKDLAGVVTVVGRKDGVVDLETVGDRSVADRSPMTKDTVFRIASMTKPVTAIAVMILADEGKLSPDDPVQKHLPEFTGQMLVAGRTPDTVTLKKPARPITLRDLLTHTSGLPGGYPAGLGDVYGKRHRTLADTTLVISQQPLQFEPGTKWAYCNAGIDTLGRVVEVVAGRPFEAFVKERVFDPLGMTDTAFYPSADQIRRLATMYDKKNGALVPVPTPFINFVQEPKHPIPAGGLFSTAPDLARLYRMMLGKGALDGKRVLSEAAVAAMTQTQTGGIKTGFTDGMSWGYGWAVVTEPTGVTEMLSPGTFGHGGAFGTQAWVDPVKGAFYVLLIQRVGIPNSDGSVYRKEFQRLAAAALR